MSRLRRWGHQGGRWVDSSSAPWAWPRLSLSAPFSQEPAVGCSSPNHREGVPPVQLCLSSSLEQLKAGPSNAVHSSNTY